MGVTVSNLLQGPAEIFATSFGATEPASASAPITVHRDLGATDGGATVTISQTYSPMKVDQVAMAVGSRKVDQSIRSATSLAEATLDNLRLALNQPGGSGGTAEVQTIGLGSATAGTVQITFMGQTTAAIPYNATAAQVQAALEALTNVAPGDVVVTGTAWPTVLTFTFGGAWGSTNVDQMTAVGTGLTGGTVTIATTTGGVAPDYLELDAEIGNNEPPYSSYILRGQRPGGGNRLVVIRRALSVETVEMSWTKDNKTMVPVTMEGYYVSKTVKAVRIDDRAS
jgi:hypothetical protein